MATFSTITWRTGVAAVTGAALYASIQQGQTPPDVDADAMLDVAVSIRTISHVRVDAVGDSVWAPGSGSGFLVSKDNCEVWTNYHVVKDAAVVEVLPRGWARSRGIPAAVTHGSPRTDLAVLQMAHCDDVQAATLGDSTRLEAGEETYAVGNPLGRNPDSISRGIISNTERYANNGTTPYLQTDAAINPGNSGGPLFNRAGHVVGMNTAIASTRGGGNVGIGYAIPINTARDAATEMRTGPPSWGWAGIEDSLSLLTPDEAEVFNVPAGHAAVVVTATPTEHPARGKFMQRDVIFAINGAKLSGVDQARRLLNAMDAGQEAMFDIVRAGQRKQVKLPLTEGWKASHQRDAEYFQGLLGMTVETWSGMDDERGRFTSPVITRVHSLGPAHKAHIASTQKNVRRRGPFALTYLLDVKTITGAVQDGEYHKIETVDQLESIAAYAFSQSEPMLLEIELWMRSDPRDASTDLSYVSTAFFRVKPQPSSAEDFPWRPDRDVAGDHGSANQRVVEHQWRPRFVAGRVPSA